MKNIHLEEENKRLSNAKEEDDTRIISLKGVIFVLIIPVILRCLGSLNKN